MYVFAAGTQTLFNPSPLLGIMVDVEYEDNEIVKFPYYYQAFSPTAPTEPMQLPPVNYSRDLGIPSDFPIAVCDPPKWTLASEVYIYCCATTLCVVSFFLWGNNLLFPQLSEQKRNEFTSHAQTQLDHYNKIKVYFFFFFFFFFFLISIIYICFIYISS